MREGFEGFDKAQPDFSKPYKLGDCTIQDCGCIIEVKHDGGGTLMQWLCPKHTETT